jgi:hypothetical protein
VAFETDQDSVIESPIAMFVRSAEKLLTVGGVGNCGAFTPRATDRLLASPPAFEALSVYVVVDPGAMERVPDDGTAPMPLSIETVLGSLTDHESTADCPVVMLERSSDKLLMVGGAGSAEI